MYRNTGFDTFCNKETTNAIQLMSCKNGSHAICSIVSQPKCTSAQSGLERPCLL
ncbi:hypothetical protein DPMN_088740 [Dreissena polymorpha]|uniref:Uncharacterized protein n=1 Tax=Dreissena polymorpha TaxID=45954 RepID=A0A9D4KVL5_DREPO|nr:hypothetical protein DPMN_088740 [Dreissena polymorpha]